MVVANHLLHLFESHRFFQRPFRQVLLLFIILAYFANAQKRVRFDYLPSWLPVFSNFHFQLSLLKFDLLLRFDISWLASKNLLVFEFLNILNHEVQFFGD